MNLYAWIYQSYGESSFYVMAASEADAREAVTREMASWPSYWAPRKPPWEMPDEYELRVLGPGEAVGQSNG